MHFLGTGTYLNINTKFFLTFVECIDIPNVLALVVDKLGPFVLTFSQFVCQKLLAPLILLRFHGMIKEIYIYIYIMHNIGKKGLMKKFSHISLTLE